MVDDLGLNLDMALFRTGDPQLGRWHQIDPKVEDMEAWSPYNLDFCNPIRFADQLGDEPNPPGFWSNVADFAKGVAVALVANNSALPTDIRRANSNVGNVNAYNAGQTVGDVISIVQGATETVLGVAGVGASGVATVGSGGIASVVSVPAAVVSGTVALHGANTAARGLMNLANQNGRVEARGKNRILDTGTPNTVQKNTPETTAKKYGPNGVVQKEFNKGHQGNNVPKKERVDHVHDHKPNPNYPRDPKPTLRQPGRTPKKNELLKDFNIRP